MPLKLEIVTPAGRLLERSAESVVLPTKLGEIGVLPGHVPLTALVEAGELRLADGSTNEAFVLGRGFVLIENDRVSILTDSAINEENIDENAVEEARARAEEALMKKEDLDPAEIDQLESALRFAIAQLSVKRRR